MQFTIVLFVLYLTLKRGTDLSTYIALVLLILRNMQYVVSLHETVIK